MILLTYSKLPKRAIDAMEIEERFREVLYLDSILKRKSADSSKESLAALLLLADSLTAAEIDPLRLCVCKKDNGRPCFKEDEKLDFSLAHSRGAVACAISTEGRVGVDVEAVGGIDKIKRVAERFFSDAERGSIESDNDLFAIWTRKEAYYKFLDTNAALTEADSASLENGEIKSFFVEGEYFISVCTEKGKGSFVFPQKITIS